MTGSRAVRRWRRVLVALDASPESDQAAAAAAGLAAALEAELEGLFVEDSDLLRFEATPLAHRVDWLTASAARLASDEMRRHLRAQAGRARRSLGRAAEREGVRWSFRVTRGTVATEIVAARSEEAVVGLGRVGWSLRRRRRLGSTARALLEGSHRPLLLVPRRPSGGPGVAVFFDGSEEAGEALRLARFLAARRHGRLLVLVPRDREAELRRQVDTAEETPAAEPEFVTLAGSASAEIAAAVRRHGSGLLLLPRVDRPETLDDLLAGLPCPLLVVR